MPSKLILQPAKYGAGDFIPDAEKMWELLIKDDGMDLPYPIGKGTESQMRFLYNLLDKLKFTLQFKKRSFYVIYDHACSGYLMRGTLDKRTKNVVMARKYNRLGDARMSSGIMGPGRKQGDLEIIQVSFDEPVLPD